MIMLFSQEITPGSDEDMHIVTKSKQDVTESNNECIKFCRTVQCSDSLCHCSGFLSAILCTSFLLSRLMDGIWWPHSMAPKKS